MATPVRFFFDYLSPYAYLASLRIHERAAEHGRDVELVPVLLAGLLGAHGTKGPAEIPAKRRYVFQDVMRTASGMDVPFRMPPRHPYNPLLALRVTSLDMAEPTRRTLMHALFREAWGTGRGVEDPAIITEVCEAVGVPDAVARASEPASKARVRDATEAAVGLGVFGVPSMRVEDQLFWGFDSFAHLDRAMAGAPPLDPDVVAEALATPSGATRR